jgi:very-short-patch-repair endonuclease
MKTKVRNIDYYKNKFIEKSNITHKNKYDYKLVNYINSTTKVEVICREHGSFFVRPDAHVRKVGCPMCNGGIKYDTVTFIKLAKQIHGELYNYSKVKYKNSTKKVKIICPYHGLFEMRPANHLNRQRCPSCSGVRKKTTSVFIRESKTIHKNKYDYSKVEYKNSTKKVKIICPYHGLFLQSPKDHIKGHGCNMCSNFSNGEKKIERILNDIGVKFIREHKFDGLLSNKGAKLPFDFYLPDYNICIEYDGRQHFEPVEKFGGELSFENLKKNDSIRNNWCKKKGVDLIRVSYKNESLDIANMLDKINKKVNNFKKSEKLKSTRFDISTIIKTKSEILDYLKSNYKDDIILDYVVDDITLDFYLPGKNLAIKVLSNFKNSEDNKTQKRTSNLEFKVIQIFEDIWLSKSNIVKYRINNIIGLNNKIGSRSCEIVQLDNKECKEFLNKYHLQGSIGSSIKIGLRYKGELVSVMTFGKMRKSMGSSSKENEWELIRFCNKGNLTVMGSASKLLKYFIKSYKPVKLISYADKLWSNYDNVYQKIGMKKISESKPSYYYILGDKRVGRFSLRKDVLVSMGFSIESTEKQICLDNNVYRIYDAGTIKFLLTI